MTGWLGEPILARVTVGPFVPIRTGVFLYPPSGSSWVR
jgi:hypothetical protein